MWEDKLFRIEMYGALVIIFTGSLLHFVYDWSGKWAPTAVFAAVNESVWEHMKIAFWPAFFFAVVQFFVMQERPENFLLAKTAGFYVMVLTIPLLYYGYTAILGKHLLPVDLAIFVLAAFLGQWVSYLLMKDEPSGAGNMLAVIPLLLIVAAFATFTFYPPQLPIFVDPRTGGYGIEMSGGM